MRIHDSTTTRQLITGVVYLSKTDKLCLLQEENQGRITKEAKFFFRDGTCFSKKCGLVLHEWNFCWILLPV